MTKPVNESYYLTITVSIFCIGLMILMNLIQTEQKLIDYVQDKQIHHSITSQTILATEQIEEYAGGNYLSGTDVFYSIRNTDCDSKGISIFINNQQITEDELYAFRNLKFASDNHGKIQIGHASLLLTGTYQIEYSYDVNGNMTKINYIFMA